MYSADSDIPRKTGRLQPFSFRSNIKTIIDTLTERCNERNHDQVDLPTSSLFSFMIIVDNPHGSGIIRRVDNRTLLSKMSSLHEKV